MDMKALRLLHLLFCLCLATLATAQVYEVHCLVAPSVKAVPADKSSHFDGSRTVLHIPNGAHVQVVGRKVVGGEWHVSNLGEGAQSLDVRRIKAVITHDGKRYLTEARWLKYATHNPPSVPDRFASDNFRPRPQVAAWLQLPRLDVHSASTQRLYGWQLPLVALLLMFGAVAMVLRIRFVLLSALPFLAAVAIVGYQAVMIDWDAFWWCNPDYVGMTQAVVGMLPVALFMALTFAYFFSVTMFVNHFLSWPLVVGYLAQWPAMLVSFYLLGNVWVALVVCYGIPMLVNGLRARLHGVVMTFVGIVALHAFVVMLAVLLQISKWILLSSALASILMSTCLPKYLSAWGKRRVLRNGMVEWVDNPRSGDRLL